MLRFPEDKLSEIVKSIPQTVYLPVKKDGITDFCVYQEGVQIDLDACQTEKSPKDLFFPQWEELMQFRLEGKNIEISEQKKNDRDFVIFGARACDLKAIEVLDKVFLAKPVDSYYEARRRHATTVGLACARPADSCFCGLFGIDPAQPEADVSLCRAEGYYYAKANTEKGEKLMALWSGETVPDGAADGEKERIRKSLSEKPFAKLSLKGLQAKSMLALFNSPKWKKLSMACLGCGSCTFACPTCQCYDIRDYDTGHGVKRYRCWDSCMYNDFTMMAHGTPRPTQLERFRQRFMHKLCYFPMNNDGLYSCVGCGRCVRKCPAGLNIVKVIRAFEEENK